MTRTTRTLVAAVAATATLGLAAGLTTAPVQAASGEHAAARAAAPQPSRFALRGWAYGTGVLHAPVSSGATGFESIGCTTKTGLATHNHQAQVTLPSLGKVSGLSSDVWTTRSGHVVSTWARNSLADVTLSDSPLGSLVLTGVTTTARAYHDGTRFHVTSSTQLAKLQFKPAVGPAVNVPVPTPSQPAVIPGFGKVEFAPTTQHVTGHYAQIYSNGLRVTLTRTGAVVKVAHAVAQISDGVVTGIFAGRSYAVGGQAAGDVVNLGRNPLLKMPCAGTGGEVRSRRLAGLDLGPAKVGAAVSEERATSTPKVASGWQRASVASFTMGDQLKIEGIVGQVNVRRSGKHLKVLRSSTTGTRIGSITVNGQTQELPLTQTLEIPGVAKLQPRVVSKMPNGLKVTALRITLLNGSGAVIDLGNAQLAIRRTGK